MKTLMENQKKILCKTCIYSVLCDDKQFCLTEDLFTYTSRIKCSGYENGSPMTEEEYEQAQNNWLSELRRQK